MSKIISWFSCGADSAIATLLAIRTLKDVDIIRIETGSEHPDNERFMHDCEILYNKKIRVVKSQKYTSVINVIQDRRFINSPNGAACTYELKKKVRYNIEDEYKSWDGQIFGFDISETLRATRFVEQYPAAKAIFPLIENNLSKSDCLAILQHHNIKLPKMYRLGYSNNNCIGCVKGGKGYWNAIRHDFPATFEEMAQIERQIGHSCIKDCFLDELPTAAGTRKTILPECSIFCPIEFMQ